MVAKSGVASKSAVITQVPALALDISVLLELVLMFFEVLKDISEIFGIDFGGGTN